MKAGSMETAIGGLAVALASIAVATPMMATGQGKNDETEAQDTETSRGGYDIGRFAEEARELGLTPGEAAALQERVDEVVAETGGMQIGMNKVLSKDGSSTITIPLPGENVEQSAPTIFVLQGPLSGESDGDNGSILRVVTGPPSTTPAAGVGECSVGERAPYKRASNPTAMRGRFATARPKISMPECDSAWTAPPLNHCTD